MIYLTSFFKSKELPKDVEPWSAAVYQPKGYNYPKAGWTDIREDKTGEWIRPRMFEGYPNSRKAYRDWLMHEYQQRRDEASIWVYSQEGDVALCCWCPYDKAAQRQLSDWGSFICHTAVVGEFITKEFKVPVWYDADRLNMTVLGQEGLNI